MGEKSGKSKSKKGDDKSQKSKSKSKEKQKSVSPQKKQKAAKKKDEAKSKKSKNPDNASDVSSIQPVPPVSTNCVHHKSPFIYFCQTCEQLICNQCTVYGPHNNHLHRILKITDAYRSRVFYLSQAIRSNLVDKRDKIIAQLHRLEYRVQQIRFVKNIIQRDVRSEYSGIIQRLKSFEGVKLANLSHEVALTQREVQTINDLGNKFFELTTLDGDQVQQDRKLCKFLLKSKQMYEAIDYLINKPAKVLPQIGLQQMPREVENNKSLLQKAIAAKQINAFKNQVIWNLVVDLKSQEHLIKREAEDKANGMIKQLSDEVQTLNEKFSSYKLICHFCGIRMDAKNINIKCQKNQAKSPDTQTFSTVDVPNQKFYGNARHFFAKSKQDVKQ